jgi:hypothetical protein
MIFKLNLRWFKYMDIKILECDSMKILKISRIIALSNNLFHTHKRKINPIDLMKINLY